MFRTRKTVRNEKEKTSFSYGLRAKRFVVSLPKGQLARPEGIILCDFFFLFLKATLKTEEMSPFNNRTWGCGDCYNLHGLRCQRVACEEKHQVLCCALGCRQLQESCQFARPQSESIFIFGVFCVFCFFSVFVCLCVRRYLFNE